MQKSGQVKSLASGQKRKSGVRGARPNDLSTMGSIESPTSCTHDYTHDHFLLSGRSLLVDFTLFLFFSFFGLNKYAGSFGLSGISYSVGVKYENNIYIYNKKYKN